MNKSDVIYVAGHRGLVGSAIVGKLKSRGYNNLILKTHQELDLIRQQDVYDFFQKERPDYVFLAAARVGGILANNTFKAEFIYENLMIDSNVIDASYKFDVKKLLNLGSSCIYPKTAPQPLKEEYLFTGPLEPTNEAYAVAKIAAIKLCRYYSEQYGSNFISVMPTNMYGPNDNFDLETSHVLPALIRKIHEAKMNKASHITLWGDGTPEREFLFSEDLAEAVLFIMENYDQKDIGELINIGMGKDISIARLSQMIADIIGYRGDFRWDTSKPNGTPKKLLDVSRINKLGWVAKTSLNEGIRKTYAWFLENSGSMETK